MKRFLYLTVCFLILGKFYGCNGDVFVDDFRSSDSELTLDGNGDVATIQFAAANWDWMYIAFDFPIQYKIYDADNRLITTDQGPSLNGLGKIVCTGEMIDFTIERVHPKEVKITVDENALSAPFQFQLRASNEYEWQEIRVKISPTDRYVMDSITYSLDAYSYNPENRTERKEGVSFHNFTDVFSTYTFSPFESFYHFMRFESDVPEAFQLLGEAGLTVEIPSMKDGYLTISAAKGLDKDEKDKEGKYIRRERYAGNMSRSFYVGKDITEKDIHGKYENGILMLDIPKKAPEKKVEEKKFVTIEG